MGLLAQLTGWDYLVLLVALLSIGIGMLRGMARTVADLASWLVAFLAAPVVGTLVAPLLGLQEYRPLVITLGFVAVFMLVRLLGVALARGLSAMGLAGADRALGGLIGTLRAILVIAVITNVMTILNYQYPIQLLVQGMVLTGAVAFYSWRRGGA